MADPDFVEQAAKVAIGGGSVGGGFFVIRWLADWLTKWSERKAARLDLQEERADTEWKKIRESVQDQLRDALARIKGVETQNMALRRAFNHVAGALIRVDPQHAALKLADQIMAEAFPLDFDLGTARAEGALDAAERAHAKN